MRSIPAAIVTTQQSGVDTTAFAVLIERKDGTRLALTSADRDVTLTGVPIAGAFAGSTVFAAAPGLDVSNLRSTEGLSVDSIEGTLLEGGVVTRESVLRGLWDGAAWSLVKYNRLVPADGFYVVKSGWLGVVQPRQGKFVFEMRDLRQPLQTEYSYVLQADCRYDLGDVRCGQSLVSFTDSVTVTGVTSNQVFSISSTRPNDFFGNGQITWLTGLNAGVSVKVKSYDSATDTFTLLEPMLLAIQVGDTATAVAGCRKRRTEDCIAKFNNVLNFGGEPDKPKTKDVLAEPEVTQ